MIEAADNLETAKALQIQQQIFIKQLEIRQLKDAEKRQQETQRQEIHATFRQKAEASRDSVLKRYPQLANTESTERKSLDAFVLAKQKDPDYVAIFQSPKWPEIIAQEFASVANLTVPNNASKVQTLNNPVATPSKAKILTSGTVATSQTQATPESLMQNLGKISSKDLLSLLGAAR
jgi:hypothetical protein